ncbi:MAG TPA: NUDIX hydrolase [Patescibacteria group bacterium]|nr:NUDIX hydrolase [Patescibacteria group bacterium]
MDNPWKKLKSKIVYENPWFSVREDEVKKPGNRQGIYGVVQTPPTVFTVALDPENQIYLVGLFRYPTGKYGLELPAGGSDNQNLLEAAKRELLEETGIEAKYWEKVGQFTPWNGISDEISHVYLAKDLKETGSGLDPNEGIMEVKKVAFEKVFDLIKSGEISDGQTISALTLAKIHLGKI